MARRTLNWLLVLQVVLLAVWGTPSSAGEHTPGQWDLAGAARYLDGREQEWFNFGGANRGEGATMTTCVSCHSLLPYALARPALRQIANEDQPTKLEAKILAQVKSRVANWNDLIAPRFQLSYDFDEDKKKQSRGTEAILYALILSMNDRLHGMEKPTPDTQAALDHLWSTQIQTGELAGSWEWLNFGLEPWESDRARYLGAALAAIAVGNSEAHPDSVAAPGLGLLRKYLTSNLPAQNMHNRVWLLWASTTMTGLLTPAQKKQLIEDLVAIQKDGGGWSLSSLGDYKKKDVAPEVAKPDGYATGLIVHVLQLAGLTKDDPHVREGLAWLRANQDPAGGWRAWSLNKIRAPESPNAAKAHVGKFMWDAATAFAVLALSH